MQKRTADQRVGFVQRHPAAEQDALSVWCGAVVIHHLAGIAGDAPAWHQPRHRLRRQGFGGNDVAADRDHPALQPRCELAGVAVGGDHHVAGGDGAARCVYLEPTALPADGGGRTMAEHPHPGGEHALEHALVKPRRVHRGVLGIDRAAEIRIAAQLAALLSARDHMHVDFEPLGLVAHPMRQRLVFRRGVGGMVASGDAEVAVDLLGCDELARPRQRILPVLDDLKRLLRAMSACQFLVARLDAGGDLPAVARAAAPAGVFGIQHQGVAPAAGGLQGGCEPGVAGADHQHIHASRQLCLR